MNNKVRHIANVRGITMIEVIMVIVISAILVSVALKSVVTVTETGRVEETKQEMEQLDFAVQGNPDLENSGVRTDFGYIGDIGTLPGGLDSLYNAPSGYSTWNGPYIQRKFSQITNDFKEDAWGQAYTYSGTEILSSGSGSNIVRRLANDTAALLYNQITGIILDNDGAPPGPDEKDSVWIEITIPDGTGGTITDSAGPDASGYFHLDSIPIGNHDIEIIYVSDPINDTLHRFVSVLPNSVLYQEYFLTFRPWSEVTPTESCFEYVAGSVASSGTNCDDISFDVHNTCGELSSVNSITLEWASPTAFYANVNWDSKAVYTTSSDRVASGETAFFSGTNDEGWAYGGEIITVKIEGFKETASGGTAPTVDMSNVDFTVTLSDGSEFSFNSGICSGT